jgi:hypothetical protein
MAKADNSAILAADSNRTPLSAERQNATSTESSGEEAVLLYRTLILYPVVKATEVRRPQAPWGAICKVAAFNP